MQAANSLISRFNDYLVTPLILLVFAAGFFLFFWGLVQFLWTLNSGGEQNDGKQHMIWGVVGMLIMVSVYGIIAVVSDTFSLGVDPYGGTYQVDTSRINNITAPANFYGQ